MWNKKILVGVTGSSDKDWQNKLKEVERFKIRKIGLFCEAFSKLQRERIYQFLLKSKVKEIPFVHLKADMAREELVFLKNNFKTKFFSIHEEDFCILKKWQGFYKNLYLEMNYDNYMSNLVQVDKISGFCLDLSHFKAAQVKNTKEYQYVMKRKKIKRYFRCNHLNGYSYEKNCDLHTVSNLKEFSYLKTLPKFVFSDCIALELLNPIKEQIDFKRYLVNLLSKVLF